LASPSPKKQIEIELFKNLFEVELKECYEDIYRYRDEEIELVNDIKMFSKKRAGTPTGQKSTSNYFSE